MNASRNKPSAAPLWLVHASCEPDAVLDACRRMTGHVSWMFFGRRYTDLLAWEQSLGDRFHRTHISHELDGVSHRLREPFMSLMTELSRRYDSPAWWTSRVSERNGWVSPLFLHCCYVHIARKQIESTAEPLCIISESWAVLHTIARIARKQRRRVRWLPFKRFRVDLAFAEYTRMAKAACRFLKRGTIASRVAREIRQQHEAKPPQASQRPRILLRTFLDDSCLQPDGTFRDRYFPGLAEWLEARGYDVWTIPTLFNLSKPYKEAWAWLHASERRFLNPDVYYRFCDVVWTVWTALRQAMIPRGKIALEGEDVSLLFAEERRRTALQHDVLKCIQLSRLPLRLKEAGFPVEHVIQVYENMIPEKGLILGLRKHLPNVRIIGYQHATLPEMLLCLFATAGESTFAPLPDRIVCNGAHSCECLIREGLNAERVVEGPALRYAHLHETLSEEQAVASADRCVLLALPIEMDPAVELLTKTASALPEAGMPHVWVKPHPMMDRGALLKACGLSELPANFEFVDGVLADWLKQASVLISGGSAALIEALVAGVPFIMIGREGDLNFDPTPCDEPAGTICHSTAEINEAVLRLHSLDDRARRAYRARGRELLKAAFNHVTDEAMQNFLLNP